VTCPRCGDTKIVMYMGHTVACTQCVPVPPFEYGRAIRLATQGAMDCQYKLMTHGQLRRLVDYLRGRLSFEMERNQRLIAKYGAKARDLR